MLQLWYQNNFNQWVWAWRYVFGLARRGSTIGFHLLAYSRISHEYSPLFIIVINLIFMFSLWCIDAFMRTEFLCISVLRVASGPSVKLASCKSTLNPPVVYSTDRSKAAAPVLVLLFVALWFILRGDLFYILLCVILFLCYSVLLALRLPRLGKRELIFRTFVRFVLVWICRFPLSLGVWEGMRFVIAALPGLFTYLFMQFYMRKAQWP